MCSRRCGRGLFGWSIMLGFVMAAIVQCLTIVGIPTALTLVELATFALLPFGSHIKCALNILSNQHGAVLLDACSCPQQRQGSCRGGSCWQMSGVSPPCRSWITVFAGLHPRRKRFLPTTVAEVEAHRKARDLGAHSLSHEHSVLQKHPHHC